jgi:hypothetical protein
MTNVVTCETCHGNLPLHQLHCQTVQVCTHGGGAFTVRICVRALARVPVCWYGFSQAVSCTADGLCASLHACFVCLQCTF